MADEHTPPPAMPAYPARLQIDYPEEGLDRASTAFRLVLLIPIGLIAGLLTTNALDWTEENMNVGLEIWSASLTAGGLVFLPVLLMIVFRRKYPRWWFDWNLELMRFTTRVSAYLFLLRDEYPSTDEQQAVHLDIDYPDASRDLNRWLPLVKWLLAFPHYVALIPIALMALVLLVVAWFAILFTGRYPREIFDFQVGLLRWGLRVQAYMALLATDRYPPFRLLS